MSETINPERAFETIARILSMQTGMEVSVTWEKKKPAEMESEDNKGKVLNDKTLFMPREIFR